jgi:hypothetical protein
VYGDDIQLPELPAAGSEYGTLLAGAPVSCRLNCISTISPGIVEAKGLEPSNLLTARPVQLMRPGESRSVWPGQAGCQLRPRGVWRGYLGAVAQSSADIAMTRRSLGSVTDASGWAQIGDRVLRSRRRRRAGPTIEIREALTTTRAGLQEIIAAGGKRVNYFTARLDQALDDLAERTTDKRLPALLHHVAQIWSDVADIAPNEQGLAFGSQQPQIPTM